ncbi:MAG: hypothetical protein ACLUOF_00225 [Ruminococcus sp.]
MKKIRRILEAKWLVMLVWLVALPWCGRYLHSGGGGQADAGKHHAPHLADRQAIFSTNTVTRDQTACRSF